MINPAGHGHGAAGLQHSHAGTGAWLRHTCLPLALRVSRTALLAAVIFGALNAVLFVYMAWFTLPFTTVSGTPVGLMSRSAAASTLVERLEGSQITIEADGRLLRHGAGELGVSFDADATFDEFQRVQGFMTLPLLRLATNPLVDAVPRYRVDEQRTIEVLTRSVPTTLTPPRAARLVLPNDPSGEVRIEPEEAGSSISPAYVSEQLHRRLDLYGDPGQRFAIEPKIIKAPVTAADLEGTAGKARAVLANELVIKREDGSVATSLSPLMRTRLLAYEDKRLTVDRNRLEQYLREELSLYFFSPPVHARVNGGVPAAEGADGTTLDPDAGKVLTEAFLGAQESVTLGSSPFPKAIITDGVYPRTDAGLHALISDFDAEKRGSYRIIVRQLKEGGLGASHHGLTPTVPASTYKAFIAYAAMKAAELGRLTLQDRTPHGTVTECMHEMIHHSTDFCAWAIQDHMGWQAVDDYLLTADFRDTRINNEAMQNDKITTPLDEYKLMRGLYDGSLLNKEHTDHILGLMKNQKWRSGIPAGSSPSVVADKVGFYAGYINDVGIVYAPQGDYIVIALSDGGSFWEIQDLSRRIYRFFGNQ